MDPKCREMMEKMQEYLDGECSEETCRMVEKHLNECDDCGACMESIKKTIELLKRSGTVAVPDDAKRTLREALKSCLE